MNDNSDTKHSEEKQDCTINAIILVIGAVVFLLGALWAYHKKETKLSALATLQGVVHEVTVEYTRQQKERDREKLLFTLKGQRPVFFVKKVWFAQHFKELKNSLKRGTNAVIWFYPKEIRKGKKSRCEVYQITVNDNVVYPIEEWRRIYLYLYWITAVLAVVTFLGALFLWLFYK